LNFKNGRQLEFMNVGGGSIWLRWDEDLIPMVGGATSTPLAAGVAYYRSFTPSNLAPIRVGVIAEAAATLVANIVS
jgi:hypothetical protein